VVQAKLASYLGPHDFGKLSLVLAFYVLFLLFIDFGISRYVIKKISEDRSLAGVYFSNFLLVQFFMAGVLFALFLIIPRIFNYDADVSRAMAYAGIGLFFLAMSIPAVTIVQAWQKIHIYAAVIFCSSLLKAIWFAYAIWQRLDIVFVMQIYIWDGIFNMVIWYLITRRMIQPDFRLDRQLLQKMFLFGVPFAMLSGFEMLIAKIDVVIQKIFLPYAEVGLYSAAYRFLDFLTFLPAIVAISLFPYFSQAQDLNSSETSEVADRINRFMMTIALPLGFGGMLFARQIITALFGDGYHGAILPFQILIWSTAITLVYAVSNVIMQVKQTRLAVSILALATLVNIAGNFLLVPKYGIVASAWMTVLSYILVAALYIHYSRRHLRFFLHKFVFWPLVASAVMGAVLWVVRDYNIFLLVALGIVIYFGILFAVGFLKRDDLKTLSAIMK